ncbi:hypothetical protein FQR65_LT15488 [Abscondita terminalis]|nr:hypothetical protein FQR65_LT15488 [Abscondita terminalis]
MFETLLQLKYEDFEIEEMELGILSQQVALFKENMSFYMSQYKNKIFAVKGAEIQGSLEWKMWRTYFITASITKTALTKISYQITITLNRLSGAVISGTCECKQSALGKCSHVAVLLLFLAKYTEEHGYEGEACTTRLREWGLGAKNKQPGAVASKEYQLLDFEIEEMELGILSQQVALFKENMSFYMSQYKNKIFAVKGAEIQGSLEWKMWRTYFITASITKTALTKISYQITITLNRLSGAVISGTCECKQSALGKCSHVAALLLFLAKYTEEHGYEGEACTTRLREWGLGAKNKQPGAVASKEYQLLVESSKVTLKPEDVSAAVLQHNLQVADHSNLQLQRWLECRGLKKTGTKMELVKR